MKDIDFEELDRAVSSVLQKSEDVSSDVDTSQDLQDSTEAATTPAKKTLVQKRTSGRFMDVVHPSSDMRNQNKPTVSRQALDITPPTPKEEELTPVESNGDEQYGERSSVVDTPDTTVETEEEITDPDLHTLPDPLDFHNFTTEDETAPENESEEPATVEDVRSSADATQEDEDKGELLEYDDMALEQTVSELAELDGLMQDQREMPSLDTPFVSDLAVEKRPLGAFSIGTEDGNEAESEEETPAEINTEMSDALNTELAGEDNEDTQEADVEESLVAAQTPPDAEIIPEELHEDVVAVESREVEAQAPVETPNVAPTTDVPAGGSIPQQYTEKPSTQPTDATPVFDTNDYHQPLKHVEQKKSGWLIVVLIIVFILLGVGAGAAIYFFDPFGLIQ